MKNIIFAISLCLSVTAIADVSYDCKNIEANEVGLPISLYIEIEGRTVSLQNSANDLYYTGNLAATINASGDKVAVGFKDLILDGSVIVSKGMLKGKKTANLTIVDEALDSVETVYTCELVK